MQTQFFHRFLFLSLSVFLLSCSEKPTAGDKEPQSAGGSGAGLYSLEIMPSAFTRDSILRLVAKGFNPSDVKITWLVNNAVSEESGPLFKASETQKGDTVQASAEIDGTSILSNSVEIANSAPAITSFKLMPETWKAGEVFYVDAVFQDGDQDAVTASYEWTINGEAAGTGQRLMASPKRGDRIYVKVTPFDGEAYGSSVFLEKTIVNMPPVVTEHTASSFDGSVYSYQVKASDSDGDALTYSLDSPAPGMTVNSSTGLLKWAVPKEFKGNMSIPITVSDGKGGTAKYSIAISIAD